jgi:hypothetical protein
MTNATVLITAVLGIALTASGCMQYRQAAAGITPAAECPDMARGCGTTVWSFAWGAFYAGQPERALCGEVGLQEVTVRTSPPNFVVSLITVGLVAPRRVEWKCARPAPDEGIIRDAHSYSGGSD